MGIDGFYRDTAQPVPLPQDWPHHLVVRSQHAGTILGEGPLADFASVLDRCRVAHLNVQAVAIAGSVADLGTPEGWLTLCEMMSADARSLRVGSDDRCGKPASANGDGGSISANARFMGPVLLGHDVRVDSNAVLIGPSILCRGSTVQERGRGGLVCRGRTSGCPAANRP